MLPPTFWTDPEFYTSEQEEARVGYMQTGSPTVLKTTAWFSIAIAQIQNTAGKYIDLTVLCF